MTDSVVVVGGSVAGVGVVTELRRLGDERPITLVEAQEHLPYDRPPLSKGVLTGELPVDGTRFHDEAHYEALGVTVRLGARARALRPADLVVELDGGEELPSGDVVIASGARARALPGVDPALVHLLRVRADAVALRSALACASRVVVVGGGFIGSEVAASAAELGLEVVVVEATASPFESRVGAEVAGLLLDAHRRAGVDVRCGTAVVAVEATTSGRRVLFGDGTVIDADVVVAGLGAEPASGWLSGSGIATAAGAVVCDGAGRTSVAGVYAAGDVATWPDPGTGGLGRHEHWTSAREQARIVAHAIAGRPVPAWSDAVPYVWSDQHGARVQILGRPELADTPPLVQREGTGAFLALYGRGGALVGAVGRGVAGRLMRLRPLVAAGADLGSALAAAAPRPPSRSLARAGEA